MRTPVRLLCLALALSASAADAGDTASTAKWREDVAYFRTELPRRHHRDFYFRLPRAEFDRLVDELTADVPRLQDHEIKVRLAGIVARLGDRHGHTRVVLNFASAGFHVLPLNFYRYTDGLFVRAASKQHAAAAGARVVRIGDIEADEAMRRVLGMAAGDNDMSRCSYAQELLAQPEVLRALKIVNGGAPADPVALELQQPGGEKLTITVAALETLEGVEWVDIRNAAPQKPLHRRYPPASPAAESIPARNFWYEYLADAKLLYVNYSAVLDAREQSLEAFFDEVFAFADAHEGAKLVIDVRRNGGGNNMLNHAIFRGLVQREKTIAAQDRLFILIGRETFSAAQNFVNYLAANSAATFVGEPTGGSPNHYGDSTRFTLPNSKLVVRASTLWWQDAHPADRRPWIAPHIAAKSSAADDREGRDPALDAVIGYAPEPTVHARLREAVIRGGKEEALKSYRGWRDDPRREYVDVEEAINALGAGLFGEDKVPEAVAIFELNAEVHPRSPDALESLGRAYAATDRRDAAIAAYEQALKIDPQAFAVLERLERLRAAPPR